METHIQTRLVQHGETHSNKGSPAWRHTLTQGDIQAMWESSMETHIHSGQLALLSLFDMFGCIRHSWAQHVNL